jgi:hypothetical protein
MMARRARPQGRSGRSRRGSSGGGANLRDAVRAQEQRPEVSVGSPAYDEESEDDA